jgi:hypothetical protein
LPERRICRGSERFEEGGVVREAEIPKTFEKGKREGAIRLVESLPQFSISSAMQVEEGCGALQDVRPPDRVAFGLDPVRRPRVVDRVILGVKYEAAHDGPLDPKPRSDEPLTERFQDCAAICSSEGLLMKPGHK